MGNECYCADDWERELHSKAVQVLAEDLRMPEEDIRSIYEEILCRIAPRAKIKDYLVILVSRNVKDFMRRGIAKH